MTLFAFDTETFLISPGAGAPPVVCLQYAIDEKSAELIHVRDPMFRRVVEGMLSTRDVLWSGHNIAYDIAVLCAHDPEWIAPFFEAFEQDRITCTAVRQKLLDIAHGVFEGDPKRGMRWGYGLADCSKRLLNVELDKSDPWRLKYGTLIDTPVTQWPEEAKRYALLDARTQYDVHTAQGDTPLLADQYRQTRAAFWLRLMECWGMRTDAGQVERYHAEVLASLEKDKAIAIAAGLVRVTGTKDTKAAMRRMVEALREHGEEPTLTDGAEEKRVELSKAAMRNYSASEFFALEGAGVKVDEDSCLLSGDEALIAYQRYGSSNTTLSRVERLRKGVDTPLQSSFQSIVETGRTSCRMGTVVEGQSPPSWGFQLQNLPREEGLRECFIPREGFLYCSVDYNGMELCTWAQACIWLLGDSRLAKVINAGKDPHTELGATLAHIAKEEAYAILRGERGKDAQKAFKIKFRQLAKIANFGFPGGMGAKKLRIQARQQYAVVLTLDEVYALRAAWLEEWPEARPYFDLIAGDLRGPKDDAKGFFTSLRSKRVRGPIGYTVACNNYFQGLAADAAKAAGFALAKEMYAVKSSPLYGSRLVNFIHDEFIAEVPIAHAHEAATRMRDVMVGTAQSWLPDVKVTAEPALMRRWSKNAEPKYVNERLVAYDDAA